LLSFANPAGKKLSSRRSVPVPYIYATVLPGIMESWDREYVKASVAPEFPGFPDIFKFMLVDHDRDQVGIDSESFYQSSGKFFNNCTFLLERKSLSHPDSYYGHG
jgi:hypothetical protein